MASFSWLGKTIFVTLLGISTKGSLGFIFTFVTLLFVSVNFLGVFFFSLNSPSCLTGSFVFTSDII